MQDNDAVNFKIRLDDDDALSDEQEKGIPVDKGSKGAKSGKTNRVKSGRGTLAISIFFFCIITIGLFYAYIDIKKRLDADISKRAVVVTNMSLELEANFAAIASDYEALGKNLDKTALQISDKFTKMEKTVKALSSSKADTREFNSVVKGLKAKFAPLENDMKTVTSDISALSQSLEKSMANLEAAVVANTAMLNAASDDLADLNLRKMDKTVFETSFQAEIERYAKLISNLNQELDSMKYKIKTLENHLLKTVSGTISPEMPSNPESSEKSIIIIEETIR